MITDGAVIVCDGMQHPCVAILCGAVAQLSSPEPVSAQSKSAQWSRHVDFRHRKRRRDARCIHRET